MSTKWTEAEIVEARNTFARIKERGFPVPLDIIFGLTESFFTIAIECAVVKKTEGPAVKWEALWIKRPANDRYYPNMWHMPGKMQLPHEPMRRAVERVLEKEVGFPIDGNSVPDIGFFENENGLRGHEHQHQFCIIIRSDVTVKTEADESHQWVNVFEAPPAPIIPTHEQLLESVRVYLARHA